MKKFAGLVLLICAAAGMVYAQTKKAPATPAKSAGPSVSDSVKQLEKDWTDAMKAKDADKVAAILADDWVGLNPDGSKETKKQLLDEIKSGAMTITTFDMGPMDVKVVGSVAIVQGSDTEKSTNKGKDTSGKFVWMDVFANHGGKWQAVRSQLNAVK